MPSLSHRGEVMPPSPIRKLVPYAEDAKRRGIHVHHVNIGQPDIETPETFRNAVRGFDNRVLAYGHSAGLWEYRDQLVRYYARHDVEVTNEEIVVTTGGSEAITFAFMSIADPGDEVIVPEPFYTNYLGFAVESGIQIVPVSCRIDDGFALPKIEDLVAKITPRTRAIMICNPNNPTGYVYTEEELEALVRISRENDLFLLADEVYREFVYDGKRARSILTFQEAGERTIMLDSVSKRYSACGARVGCLVTHNRDVIDAALKMGQARLCPPTLGQIAAAAAVDTPPSYFEAVHRDYEARRNAVLEELRKMPGVTAPTPQGAFYCVARLPVADADDFARWLLEAFDLDGETVMVAPAAGFYATEGLGRDEVRIAYVLNVTALRRAMSILAAGLDEYGRK